MLLLRAAAVRFADFGQLGANRRGTRDQCGLQQAHQVIDTERLPDEVFRPETGKRGRAFLDGSRRVALGASENRHEIGA